MPFCYCRTLGNYGKCRCQIRTNFGNFFKKRTLSNPEKNRLQNLQNVIVNKQIFFTNHICDGTILQLFKIRFKCANFNNNFHINKKKAKLYHVITLFRNYTITSREHYFRHILTVWQSLLKFAHLNWILDSSCKIVPSQKWMQKRPMSLT